MISGSARPEPFKFVEVEDTSRGAVIQSRVPGVVALEEIPWASRDRDLVQQLLVKGSWSVGRQFGDEYEDENLHWRAGDGILLLRLPGYGANT